MTQTELIAAIAEQSGFTKAQAKTALQSVIKAMTATLSTGERFRLTNFGSFRILEIPEHGGRNPQTGQPLTIAASKRAAFRASSVLKNQLNA